MRQYEVVRQQLNDAAAVEEARGVVGSARQVTDRTGNTESIEAARERAYRLRGGVAEAETRRGKLRVTAQLLLLEHTRLGANRDAKARAAMLAESGLPA